MKGHLSVLVVCVGAYGQLFNPVFCLSCIQYSAKEDKYEEEIKVLTDKLKEVSSLLFVCVFVDRYTV